MAFCSVKACVRDHYGKGLCKLHWRRQRDRGTTADPVRPSTEERFLAFCNRNGPLGRHRPDLGPCWLWTGHIGKHGKGYASITIRVEGKHRSIRAHRWAYDHWVGPIPAGKELDHFACDRTDCVNPHHVRPATGRENLLRSTTTIASINLAKESCPMGHAYDACRLSDHARLCMTCERTNGASRKRAQRARRSAARRLQRIS